MIWSLDINESLVSLLLQLSPIINWATGCKTHDVKWQLQYFKVYLKLPETELMDFLTVPYTVTVQTIYFQLFYYLSSVISFISHGRSKRSFVLILCYSAPCLFILPPWSPQSEQELNVAICLQEGYSLFHKIMDSKCVHSEAFLNINSIHTLASYKGQATSNLFKTPRYITLCFLPPAGRFVHIQY